MGELAELLAKREDGDRTFSRHEEEALEDELAGVEGEGGRTTKRTEEGPSPPRRSPPLFVVVVPLVGVVMVVLAKKIFLWSVPLSFSLRLCGLPHPSVRQVSWREALCCLLPCVHPIVFCRCGVNLGEALQKKIAKNKRKYPAEASRGSHRSLC